MLRLIDFLSLVITYNHKLSQFFIMYFSFIAVMARDAKLMRGDGPVVFAQVKHGVGVGDIFALIEKAYVQAMGAAVPEDTTHVT